MESLMTDSDGLAEETNIEKFWNDGFVILRNIIDPDYVLSMEDPISRVMNEDATDLSELGSLITPETTLTDRDISADKKVGRFLAGTDHWINNKILKPLLAIRLFQRLWHKSFKVNRCGSMKTLSLSRSQILQKKQHSIRICPTFM